MDSRPPIGIDKRPESGIVIRRVETRGLGLGDRLGLTLDLAHRGLAPFGQVGVGVACADPHRDPVDRLLEAFRQRHLGPAPSFPDDHLGGNVPPVDDLNLRHARVVPDWRHVPPFAPGATDSVLGELRAFLLEATAGEGSDEGRAAEPTSLVSRREGG
mgnify:CR=1 FL=1